MQNLYTLAQMATHIPGAAYLPGEVAEAPVRHYVFDTRNITEPETSVFLALPGELRDGHQYIAAAWQRGIRRFMVTQADGLPAGAQAVVVADVLAALQTLAAWHRSQYTGTVLAITGSNGKTIVKEWLATLMEDATVLHKSPRSYNSQLGVALTLLGLRSWHTLALVECGISRPGEMARLHQMVRPDCGILTRMGDAHAEGFASLDQKLDEKLLLFGGTRWVVCTADDAALLPRLHRQGLHPVTTGRAAAATVQLRNAAERQGRWHFTLSGAGASMDCTLPVGGPAAFENAALALAAALQLGLPPENARLKAAALLPVELRTELITDNPEITLINDAYNADAVSVQNAMAMLERQRYQPGRVLILTDLEHQGARQQQVQQELAAEAAARFGPESVLLVGEVFARLDSLPGGLPAGVQVWPDLAALEAAFRYENFAGKTVLLKGARRYQLERLIPVFSQRPEATYLKINLNALRQNLAAYRRRLPRGMQLMVMLKAAAYGGGAWQLARELEAEGLDYVGVAYPAEGIDLRRHGIQAPIMVMNAHQAHARQLAEFKLEPALWSLQQLQLLAAQLAAMPGATLPVHLEFDTGMGRLGFQPQEAQALLDALLAAPALIPQTLYTHLTSAEDPADDEATRYQLELAETLYQQFARHWPGLKLHALNTAGIERWGSRPHHLARLGIGLYGVSPSGAGVPGLQEIGSLTTSIAQIHQYPEGQSISYNRRQVLARDSRIATLALGYADGVPRNLGLGNASFLIHGQLCPTVGIVCMDMLMVDVTDVPLAQPGDEAVLFGGQGGAFQSVKAVAAAAGTIPYDILAGISQRVRRVYVQE